VQTDASIVFSIIHAVSLEQRRRVRAQAAAEAAAALEPPELLAARRRATLISTSSERRAKPLRRLARGRACLACFITALCAGHGFKPSARIVLRSIYAVSAARAARLAAGLSWKRLEIPLPELKSDFCFMLKIHPVPCQLSARDLIRRLLEPFTPNQGPHRRPQQPGSHHQRNHIRPMRPRQRIALQQGNDSAVTASTPTPRKNRYCIASHRHQSTTLEPNLPPASLPRSLKDFQVAIRRGTDPL